MTSSMATLRSTYQARSCWTWAWTLWPLLTSLRKTAIAHRRSVSARSYPFLAAFWILPDGQIERQIERKTRRKGREIGRETATLTLEHSVRRRALRVPRCRLITERLDGQHSAQYDHGRVDGVSIRPDRRWRLCPGCGERYARSALALHLQR